VALNLGQDTVKTMNTPGLSVGGRAGYLVLATTIALVSTVAVGLTWAMARRR